ncbi:putative CRISPR-associated protein [uncultured Thiohalocapsa sp.]|uniref:putative CRISPR-associated protein n=1 Tax=uncultured Thiohalocapsa sp. TaxID=768990 RepID=UPI0025EEFA71|nr:putative CRISPR-associated protein [uncultured Thiohalocapsa sp.]
MPTLILSTCGTSLLTNVAGDQRGLVTRHANARESGDVPPDDRRFLSGLISTCRDRLFHAGTNELAQLSAELNSLVQLYDGQLQQTRDTHWLITTDTWLGSETAASLAETLERAGHQAIVKRISDLRTNDLNEFRIAMAELARLCAQDVHSMAEGGWRVVFNLTGGFKSVQGFMQALGMLYADESIYVFERTEQLLRLPQLPVSLDADVIVRKHEVIFRRLAVGLSVTAQLAKDMPDTLLMEDDGFVTLSVWGDVVWNQAGPKLLNERVWPSPDTKLRYGDNFCNTLTGCSPEECRMLNERIGELARHLHDDRFHPSRLDFKKLKVAQGISTHECDAWAKASAKRLFGHFDAGVYVLDKLAPGLNH